MNLNNPLNVGRALARHVGLKPDLLYSLEDIIVADHFVDVNKTISMPKGAEKEVPDLMFTNNRFSKFPGVMP